MTTVEIKVTPATKGAIGAATVEYWIAFPPYSEVGVRNPVTGAVIAIPEGTVKAYLEKHIQEFGGSKAYVRVEIGFHHDPAETAMAREKLANRKTLTPKDFLEGVKNGTIRLNEPLSAEQIALLEKGEWHHR